MRRITSSAVRRPTLTTTSTTLTPTLLSSRFVIDSHSPSPTSRRHFSSTGPSPNSSSNSQSRASSSAPAPASTSQSPDTAQAEEQAIMTSKLIPQSPSDVMVIRDVTPNITTFSVPFARFGSAQIGGRGTLVKLSSGALAVFSPVALTDETKAKVAELGGQVGYIVALDIEHHIFVSEWAKAYPGAKIIGPEGLPEKRAKQSDEKIGKEEFAVVFTKANKREVRISEEFDADFDYEYMDGHGNRELVFYYRKDKVLIEADLMFNLPATEQYSRVPEAQKQTKGFAAKIFTNVQTPEGDVKWLKRFTWYLIVKDRPSFDDSVRRIDQWDFDTIIPCHGDVAEGSAKALYRKVFEWHLNGKH